MSPIFTLAALVVGLSQLGVAQNFTASTCVSPAGFNDCYTAASNFFESCVTKAGSDLDEAAACGCVLNLETINCALANCWNVVYGCEYQNLGVVYNAYCSGDDVPFFPAPDNAPGGCSCNLGHVLFNITNAEVYSPNCITSDLNRNDACLCCAQSGVYTSLYEICPAVNPDNFLGTTGLLEVLSAEDPQFGQCGDEFAQYNCVKDIGYPAIGDISYLSSFPATTGSSSYSDTSGTITAPLSGATFTWTALNEAWTITAAAAGQSTQGGASSGKVTASSRTGTTTTRSAPAVAGSNTASASASVAGTPQSSGTRNAVKSFSGSNLAFLVLVAVACNF